MASASLEGLVKHFCLTDPAELHKFLHGSALKWEIIPQGGARAEQALALVEPRWIAFGPGTTSN